MTLEREQQLENAISRLNRIKLGYMPTPLEALPRLSQATVTDGSRYTS